MDKRKYIQKATGEGYFSAIIKNILFICLLGAVISALLA